MHEGRGRKSPPSSELQRDRTPTGDGAGSNRRAGSRQSALTTGLTLVLACLAVVGLFALAGAGAAGASQEHLDGMDGNGTAGDPYVITNATELQAMSADLSANYTLGNDVDASDTATWNDEGSGPMGFDPVGNASDPFTGSFDGDGHAIEGLTIDRGDNRIGLFGQADDATVENVTLAGVEVDGGDRVGGLVGVGGPSTITNVTVSGTVSGGDYVGGLAGTIEGDVSDAHASVDASGSIYVGGLVGAQGGTVTTSSANGSASGSQYVGGLVGQSFDGTIEASFANTTITSGSRVGGLVGENNGEIERSIAVGEIEGGTDFGGLVGVGDDPVTNSYWDVEATGQEETAGDGVGLTTDRMTGVSPIVFMDGLDFVDTWTLTEGYPQLADEDVEALEGVGIADVETNSPAGWDEPLVANVTVVNAGQNPASSDVNLTIENGGTVFDESEAVAGLGHLANETVSFAWAADEEDEGSYTATATTSDDEAETAVLVVEPIAGNGTEGDPFVLSTARHFLTMYQNLSAHYALGADLDASNTSTWNDGAGFAPIGSSSEPFTGTFDGDGHAIEGLTLDRDHDGVGLFGVADNATIENVTLADVEVDGGNRVGGLVGVADNATIEDVTHADVEVDGNDRVGGLAGRSNGASTITNVTVSGSVSGDNYVGGLAGTIEGNVSDAHTNVEASGFESVGGLVGMINSGTVTTSSANGSASGSRDIGGLAGQNAGLIEASFADATADGNIRVGGLVGQHHAGEIERSIAVGEIEGGTDLGGLVGVGNDPVTDSYWDVNATGQEETAGDGVGLTTGQMTGAGPAVFMDGLDFVDTWSLTEGYPSLDEGVEALEGIGVADVETNSSVASGETLGANVTVVNLDQSPTGGDVDLTIENGGTVFDENETVTNLGSFDDETVSFAWETDEEDGGSYVATATTAANGAEALVFVVAPAVGNGTEGDPFVLSTALDLQEMNRNRSAHYVLGADIDANLTAAWNGGDGFAPIGNQSDPFNGTLDGAGHAIEGLTIDRESDDDGVGLFGVADNATIENVTLVDATVRGGGHVGGLVGNASSTTIERVAVESASVSGSGPVGGLVGAIDGTVDASSATGTASGAHVGGLVGANDGTITASFATTDATATDSFGTGLGNGAFAGGLVGVNEGTITASFATGDATATAAALQKAAGGLVGRNNGSAIDTYATGAATNGGGIAGGLVGVNEGPVNRSYSTGAVTGGNFFSGGLTGFDDSSVTDSYWDTVTSGLDSSGGEGTGLATANITGAAAAGNMSFDFDGAWTATDEYPHLRWEVENLTLGLDETDLDEGDTTDATVTLSLVDGSTVTADAVASVTSGDGDVATVGNGTVTARASGTTTIAADHAGHSDGVALSVQSAGGGGGDDGDQNEQDETDDQDEQDSQLSAVLENGEVTFALDGTITGIEIVFADDASGTVTVEAYDDLPAGAESIPDATGAVFVDVTVPQDVTDAEATMQLTLDAATFGDVAPEDLVVYHYDDDDGEWTVLETTVVSTDGGEVVLEATTPGFSLFAVGPASQQTTPDDGAPDDVTPTPDDSPTGTATPPSTVGGAPGEDDDDGGLPIVPVVVGGIVLVGAAAVLLWLRKS